MGADGSVSAQVGSVYSFWQLLSMSANTVITKDTVVVGTTPRISAEQFAEILLDADSPAAPDAFAMYESAISVGIEPCYALAFFKHESQFGKVGVCHDYETHSPGNTRTSRIGVKTFVTVPGKGQYVKYADWPTGMRDACLRLADPNFVYAQRGAVTIGQILPIWAPTADNNSPDAYIKSVCDLMNEWIAQGGNMAPKPTIKWVGSPNHWTGRDNNPVIAIVDHIMQGTMGSTRGWFNNPASQVSSTFGVGKDGSIEQYVALTDAAWANGIAENIDVSIPWLANAISNKVNENNLTVSIEHEGNTGDVMPEAQYQATLALHRWLISQYNIQVDRKHILGHYQISGHIKANCPGTGFPWSRLMADLSNATVLTTDSHTPLPKPDANQINGHVLGGGFRAFYDKLAAVSPNFQLLVLGYPVTDEFDCDVDGNGKPSTVQLFERTALIYEKANASPWDIHPVTTAQLDNVLAAAKAKSLLN
jgi:N-acetyl-anhydromuramyl-L-alanine amidase AmpD